MSHSVIALNCDFIKDTHISTDDLEILLPGILQNLLFNDYGAFINAIEDIAIIHSLIEPGDKSANHIYCDTVLKDIEEYMYKTGIGLVLKSEIGGRRIKEITVNKYMDAFILLEVT